MLYDPKCGSEGHYISCKKCPSLVSPAHIQGGFTPSCKDKTEIYSDYTGIPKFKHTYEKNKREKGYSQHGVSQPWKNIAEDREKLMPRIELL